MASSYYRRTSGHERDTILRQGTEADLTSGQIYGRTSGLSILARKADPTSERPIQRTPIMIKMIAMIPGRSTLAPLVVWLTCLTESQVYRVALLRGYERYHSSDDK